MLQSVVVRTADFFFGGQCRYFQRLVTITMATLNISSIAINNDDALKTNYINVVRRGYQLCSLRGDSGNSRPACHATTGMENTKATGRNIVDVRNGVGHGSCMWLDPKVFHSFHVSSLTSDRFIPGFFRFFPAIFPISGTHAIICASVSSICYLIKRVLFHII